MIDYSGFKHGKGKPHVVNQLAKKARLADDERACRAAVDLRDHRVCFFPGCRKYATDKHHLVSRSRLGKWRTDNILSSCAPHHRWFKAGLIRTTGNPDDGPVTVLLTPLGVEAALRIPARRAA